MDVCTCDNVYINITCLCIYKKDMGMSVCLWMSVSAYTEHTHIHEYNTAPEAHEHYLAMIDERRLD